MAEQQSAVSFPPRLLALLFFPAVLLIGIALGAWLATGGSLDTAAFILLVVLSALAVAIFRRAARNDPDGPLLFQVLLMAWLAKIAAMSVKLFLLNAVYGGSADARQYHAAGAQISRLLTAGILPDLQQFWGTEFIQLATGVLYAVTGPTFVGGQIVWSWLGTLGMLWHYKAFVTAFPRGNRRLFMALIFFAPSVLMWTNSVGKDALMAFTLGVAAYGAARAARAPFSLGTLALMGIGLGGTLLVRPHVAAILAVALVALILLRPVRAGMLTPFVRIGGFITIAILAAAVLRTSATFINLQDLSIEGVTEFMETEQEGTEQGGSAFVGTLPFSPRTLALGVVTVLFRPFPWEAPGILGLAAALESLALLALIVWRLRSVLRAWVRAFRDAYLAFNVVYVTLFVFFFSLIANFGILVRQRVQVLPFVFVLLAYEAVRQEAETRNRDMSMAADRAWQQAVARVRR